MSIQRFPAVNNNSGSSGGLQGTWDASTNTPALANTDTGKLSYMYQVSVGGTVDFGAGNVVFEAKDIVVNNGTVWDKIDSTDSVISVNGNNGLVVLDADDIGDGTTNKAFTSTLKTKLDGLTARVTEIKTSNYTVVTGDKGKLIISDHATTNPQTITMGTGLGWNVGDSITILNGHNSRDLQITKSGWIYWNDVSANVTLKPYEGIKITNVATDYYLTQTFNTFTPAFATALANLLDPIKKVQHTYSQNPNSTNFNAVQGTNITPSETAYYKYVAVVPVKIPDLNVTAVWLKSLRSCYDFRAKITAPNGTVTHFSALGSVTDVNTEFSIDTSGATVNDIWLVEIEFFIHYSSSSQSIRTKLVGSGYFSIEQANAYLMKVG